MSANKPDAGRNRVETYSFPMSKANISFRFRSFSGDCNNLERVKNGGALTPHQRILPAEYDDGEGSIQEQPSDESIAVRKKADF